MSTNPSPPLPKSQIPLPTVPSSPGIPIARTKSSTSSNRSSVHPYAKPPASSSISSTGSGSYNVSGTINSTGTIGRAKGKRSNLSNLNGTKGNSTSSTSTSSSIPTIDYASVTASSIPTSTPNIEPTSTSTSIPTPFPPLPLESDSSSIKSTTTSTKSKSKRGKRSPRLSLGESTAKSTASIPTTTITTTTPPSHNDHLSALAPSFTPGLPLLSESLKKEKEKEKEREREVERKMEEEFPRLESVVQSEIVPMEGKEEEVKKVEGEVVEPVKEVEKVEPVVEAAVVSEVVEEEMIEIPTSAEEVIAGPSLSEIMDVDEVLSIEKEKPHAKEVEIPVEVQKSETSESEAAGVSEQAEIPVVESVEEVKEEEILPSVIEPVVEVESPVVAAEVTGIEAEVAVPESIKPEEIEVPVVPVSVEEEKTPIQEDQVTEAAAIQEESIPYIVNEAEEESKSIISSTKESTLASPILSLEESPLPTFTPSPVLEESLTSSNLIHSPLTSHEAEEGEEEDKSPTPTAADPPSLTLAIVTAWNSTSWSQRIPAILASVAINFGLPFINGVMLGFGELFARNVIGVKLGWGNPFVAPSSTGGANTTTGSLGLRAAGTRSLQSNAGKRNAEEAVVQVITN